MGPSSHEQELVCGQPVSREQWGYVARPLPLVGRGGSWAPSQIKKERFLKLPLISPFVRFCNHGKFLT